MPRPLEYHSDVRQLFSPAVTLLSLLGILVFLQPSALGQINAPPSSVTSPGFGGRPVNGTASSVTSVGPRGYVPKTSVPFRQPMNGTGGDGRHRHHRDGGNVGPYWYAVPVPYADESYATDDAPGEANDESNYQGGPTVFDRRGSGARSYIPPVEDPPAPHTLHSVEPSQSVSSDPEPPTTPSTLLIFKDGHKLEIGNYAIVGLTLFDLTPGHSRRISISDLDIDATRKENDERGVVFEIPASVQGN